MSDDEGYQRPHDVTVERTDVGERHTCRRCGSVTPTPPELPCTVGELEAVVRQDLQQLVSAHPLGESLEAMALELARTLDSGAGLAVAAVNRELRATLDALAGMGAGGDSDLDDLLSTPGDGGLPSQVRDREEPS